MIEKNEALHWVFAFPRFSVLEGYEEGAFVPYESGWWEKAKELGVGEKMRGTVVNVRDEEVILQGSDGREQVLRWDYLVVATGCEQTEPARLRSQDSQEACGELRRLQGNIKLATRVAVVGGGAVGVELAADIKDTYPEKDVTLVHSRKQLLNAFGDRLHEHSLSALEKLGVRVVLGERPVTSSEIFGGKTRTLTFSDGRAEDFDLIVSRQLSLILILTP